MPMSGLFEVFVFWSVVCWQVQQDMGCLPPSYRWRLGKFLSLFISPTTLLLSHHLPADTALCPRSLQQTSSSGKDLPTFSLPQILMQSVSSFERPGIRPIMSFHFKFTVFENIWIVFKSFSISFLQSSWSNSESDCRLVVSMRVLQTVLEWFSSALLAESLSSDTEVSMYFLFGFAPANTN